MSFSGSIIGFSGSPRAVAGRWRRLRTTGAVLIAAALLAGAASAEAAVTLELGPYSVSSVAGVFGSGFKDTSSFGEVSLSSGIGSATAEAGTTPAPFVSASAQFLINNTETIAVNGGSAGMNYFMRVNGPATGLPVTLWITAAITVQQTDGAFFGKIGIVDTSVLGTVLFKQELCWGMGDGPSGSCENPVDNQTLTLTRVPVSVLTGHLLSVQLQAQANAADTDTSTASALVDPFFEIAADTPNLDAFSLQFSPGITQALVVPEPPPVTGVPEPSGWMLMLLAVLGLGAARHRRSPTA